jgi:hypothetical protein
MAEGGAGRRFTVDRFEGDLAIVRVGGGPPFDVPRELLPPEAGEGDELEIRVDADASAARRAEAAERLARLRGE